MKSRKAKAAFKIDLEILNMILYTVCKNNASKLRFLKKLVTLAPSNVDMSEYMGGYYLDKIFATIECADSKDDLKKNKTLVVDFKKARYWYKKAFKNGSSVEIHSISKMYFKLFYPDLVFKRKFRIKDWKKWDDDINLAAKDFLSKHLVYPNILVANNSTFNQIDGRANRKRIVNQKGQKPKGNKQVALEGFKTSDCNLKFCINEKLPVRKFILAYDSIPSFENEKQTKALSA
jgi:hypothetical protein